MTLQKKEKYREIGYIGQMSKKNVKFAITPSVLTIV